MNNNDFVQELAKVLEVDVKESARILDIFFGAMRSELLATKKLSVKGLGSFTVKHLPLIKKSTVSSDIYTPPHNIIVFNNNVISYNNTRRIATACLLMNKSQSRRFARLLGAVFITATKRHKEFIVDGFGRFSFVSGKYRFYPDASLAMLLNQEYYHLKEVVTPRLANKNNLGVYIFVYLSPIFLLLFALFFFLRGGSLEGIINLPSNMNQIFNNLNLLSNKTVENKLIRTVDIGPPAVSSPDVSTNHSVNPDSLVLRQNGYTIVLETLSNSASVHNEVLRLRSQRILVFVWPGYKKGVKYYRLVTGSFSNRKTAVATIMKLPQKTAGNAYIQHTVKKDVLYGE